MPRGDEEAHSKMTLDQRATSGGSHFGTLSGSNYFKFDLRIQRFGRHSDKIKQSDARSVVALSINILIH